MRHLPGDKGVDQLIIFNERNVIYFWTPQMRRVVVFFPNSEIWQYIALISPACNKINHVWCVCVCVPAACGLTFRFLMKMFWIDILVSILSPQSSPPD